MIWESAPQHPDENRQVHSFPDYLDLRAQNHTFSAMAAYSDASAIWGAGDDAADVPGLAVTSDIFQVLGTQPFLGRGFTREEEKRDGPRVAVISYSFWQARFAGDRRVLGKNVLLAGHPTTVIGVMPQGVDVSSPARRRELPRAAPATLRERRFRSAHAGAARTFSTSLVV